MKTKTKTEKRILANERQTDWKTRLLVKQLRADGWSYQRIADHISEERGLEKPLTRAFAYEITFKNKLFTIEEIKAKIKEYAKPE